MKKTKKHYEFYKLVKNRSLINKSIKEQNSFKIFFLLSTFRSAHWPNLKFVTLNTFVTEVNRERF